MKALAITAVLVAMCFVCLHQSVHAQTTAFNYQGKLGDGGTAANGTYSFQFKLFDALTAGNQVGTTQTPPDTVVTNGVFTTQLDFGAVPFSTGQNLWLEIGVRAGTSGRTNTNGPYTILTPRRQLNSVPFAVSSLNVSGIVPISSGGTGSAIQNFVDLTTNQTIGGNKTFSNTLSVGIVNATTQYNIGGERVFSTAGPFNVIAGARAGSSLTAGGGNSFLGHQSGSANTIGSNNSFVGYQSGGRTSTGDGNSFFGRGAGVMNETGTNNTIIGSGANVGNINLTNATAIGSGAVVNSNNTIALGRGDGSDTVQIPGALNVTGALSINTFNAATQYNIGGERVFSIAGPFNVIAGARAGTSLTSGGGNSFLGHQSGSADTTGSNNSFIGYQSGGRTSTGENNSFFGRGAGSLNETGSNNTVIGSHADVGGIDLTNATAIGSNATVFQSNSLVLGSGAKVGIGTSAPAYALHVVGDNIRVENSFFPRFSINYSTGATDEKKWQNYATTGALNFTALNDNENAETSWLQVNRGPGTSISGVVFPSGNVAIGIGATPDKLGVNGTVSIATLGAPGSTSLCRNAANQISTCTPGNLAEQNNSNAAELVVLREQLKQQQIVIDQLRAIVCSIKPDTAVCTKINR